jgi:dipeptidyl aminopeptidase/acylaminoacyl peptidase
VSWSSPAWSPNGQQIALLESVAAATQGEAQLHLAVIELTSGNVRHPAGQPRGLVGTPRWSPDGTRLALPYSPHDFAYPFRTVCGVVAADAGEVLCFAADYCLWLYDSLCWHPDNRTLYCLGNRGITRQLLRVDTLTGQVSPLTDAPGVHDELRISAGGQWLLCTYRTPTARSQVYLLSTDGHGRRQLTRVDDPLETLQIGATEIVRWRAADGLELEGVLVKPLEYEPGRRYPTVVDLHGGPVAYLHAEFHGEWQWLAAQGYLVFAPDFRGSQSYGWFDPPGYQEDDFQDVMAGVDWLVETGCADPDRLAVQGHSYGSWLTAWAIGHTHRFQAAVLKSSSYHNEVSYGTGPFGGNPLLAGVLGGKPWEVPENYRSYSPLTHIHTARTPTLILHGELDDIVQAEMMYAWLYQAGVEVEFVKYLGEGHVFGKSEHKIDSWRRRLAWFDKHLHFSR